MRLALILVAAAAAAGAQPAPSAPSCVGEKLVETAPAWSPDGSRIAYVASHFDGGRGSQIALVSPAGQDLGTLGPCFAVVTVEAHLRWSPDGRYLLFSETPYDRPSQGAISIVSPYGDLRPLATGWRASWSPDGGRVVFERDGAIFVIGRDGSGERRIATGTAPDWSPDGTLVSFTHDGIRVVAPDGSGEHALVKGFNAAWAPDGKRLFVLEPVPEADAEGTNAIVVVEKADGSARRVLGSRYIEYRETPRWSRDGQTIALVGNGQELWHADGTKPRFLPYSPGGIDFSPDGRSVVYPLGVSCNTMLAVLELIPGAKPFRFGRQCEIHGTRRNDVLVGTDLRDAIFGGRGNDRLDGRGGNDLVYGDVGDDRLIGGTGNDSVDGSYGNDVVLGGPGDDTLGGDDEHGRDRIAGGDGDDEIDSLGAHSVVYGGPGDDRIQLEGGGVAEGDAGDDYIMTAGNGRRDVIRCGPGHDTVEADRADRVAKDCESVSRWLP